MRKKCTMLMLLFALLFTGCETDKDSSTDVNKDNMITEDNGTSGEDATSSENSIQKEIEEVEIKSKEYEDKFLEDNMTQSDMNFASGEFYLLWDDELNSLWGRLSDELASDEKEELLDQQREWISRKEKNVKAYGSMAEGGSLQPQLENIKAEEMTRARCYILAQKLAEIRGESFEISDELQAEIDAADPTLFDVFEKFRGQWIFDEERGACIGVEPYEECGYGDENATWVVWVTGGDILTDLDVSDYTCEDISFAVKRDDHYSYYKIYFNIAGSISLAYGLSEDALEEIIIAD